MVVGVAASIKQPAFLAFYPVALIRHPWPSLKWADTWPALRRLALSLAVSVGVFVAITFATGLNLLATIAARRLLDKNVALFTVQENGRCRCPQGLRRRQFDQRIDKHFTLEAAIGIRQ